MTALLWSSQDIAAATGTSTTDVWEGSGISIDTRTLAEGDIFFAISEKRDGHDFVIEAFRKGAVAAIVSKVPKNTGVDMPFVIVEDVMQALRDVAAFSVKRTSGKIIAITGSVGKTSTKDMLAIVLANFGKVHKSEKSYNNHIGLPLTLARAPVDADYIVVEIGMSNPGEIRPLSLLASPHVALITNVSKAHFASFNGISDIAKEKSEICSGLRKDGFCIISRDSDSYDNLRRNVKKHTKAVITYGETGAPCYKLVKTAYANNLTCSYASYKNVNNFYYKVSSPGKHSALNALGVLTLVSELKLDLAAAIIAIASWSPGKGRGSLTRVKCRSRRLNGWFTVIDETYNANPKSMQAAVDLLTNFTQPVLEENQSNSIRRIAILGDMLELGDQEEKIHSSLIYKLNLSEVDLVHCVGKRMKHFYNELPKGIRGEWCETVDEMVPIMRTIIRVNDVVMVKASNAMKLSYVVNELKTIGKSF